MLSKRWPHALIASVARSVKVNRIPNYRYVMEHGIMLLIGDNCLKMLPNTRQLNKHQNRVKKQIFGTLHGKKTLRPGTLRLPKPFVRTQFFFVPASARSLAVSGLITVVSM